MTLANSPVDLRDGYRECARLTRAYGTTYFWGAQLLPPESRRHVYAVYALCRLADDIVDRPGATTDPAQIEGTRTALAEFREEFERSLVHPAQSRPVLQAIAATVIRTGIATECFDRFFNAMAMDLHTTSYPEWSDLLDYMEGSAAVIGEMMLPVLRPTSAQAIAPARSLGFAFQLTNFLRDVGEDLERGRVYLPQADLDRFGADPQQRRVDHNWRELMRFQIERNRQLYREADQGLAYLPRASATCVGTARLLYAQILERIEANDYDVFQQRARVPVLIKAGTATVAAVGGPSKIASMIERQERRS